MPKWIRRGNYNWEVSSKKMSFKLSAVKDDKPLVKVDLSNEIKEDESVEINEKVLCSYWSAFADKLSHEANGGYLSSMLARHKPMVVKYNVFQVEVAHALEYDQLIENKLDLLNYLRQVMKIPNLEMDVKISDKIEGTAIAYTAKDKYKVMLEINPSLDNLKQRFDMDIEY